MFHHSLLLISTPEMEEGTMGTAFYSLREVYEVRKRMKRKALVKARLSMGLSQEKLAERIGVTRNTISEWERGIQNPYPLHVHALCMLFGQSAQELAIDARWRELEQGEMTEAGLPLDVEEAGYAQHSGDLFLAELHERLRYALKKPSAVDDVMLAHLESIANDCWRMVPVVAGVVSHHSRGYVLEHLSTVTRLLESSHLTSTHQRLCSIAGNLSLITANISSNMQDYSPAKTYYELAIEAAQEANNIPLQAVSLVRFSFNSTRHDRPDVALPLVQEAMHLLTKGDQQATRRTRSWVAAALAEVYAHVKNAQECFEALEQSELQIDSTIWEDDLYHTTFSSSLLAGYKGACYALLCLPEEAEKILRSALKQFASSPYQKGYILSDLASSCIQQGRVEEMYVYASDALTVAVQTKAPEIFQRVLTLRNNFVSWASTSYVKNLETQMHDLELQFNSRRGNTYE